MAPDVVYGFVVKLIKESEMIIEVLLIAIGFIVFLVEFHTNLKVARVFRTQIFAERSIEKEDVNDEFIILNLAKTLVATAQVRRDMIATVNAAYAAGTVIFLFVAPYSWRTGFFLATVFGHCFLLWMANVHVQKTRIYVRRLSPEAQVKVFRLARTYFAQHKQIS